MINNTQINETQSNTVQGNKLLELNAGYPDKLAEYLEELRDNDKKLPTGIQELDEILGGGLKVGGITTIAAAPTFGKSTLAIGVAENLSQQGQQVIYYTNDVASSELILKLLSRVSFEIFGQRGALTVSNIREYVTGGRLKDDVWDKVLEAFKERAKNLRIIDIKDMMLEQQVEGQGVNYMADHMLYLKKEVSNYLEQQVQPVIILDYLQTIPTGQGGKDKERIDNLVNEMKMLAIGYDLPVLLVSSISRFYYDKPIVMEALKESGGIEYGSDIIVGIQHKGVSSEKSPEENKKTIAENKRRETWQMELLVLKNKLGMADQKVGAEFSARYNYFGTSNIRKEPKTTIRKTINW